MIKPITFCIPTSKNEKDYTLLLLESLRKNTDISKHEILIFIDSDNQNTESSLLEYKKVLSNIKIYKNELGYPFGSQRNVSVMFNAAKNDIVCYLQSDMVVGKDLDKHVVSDLIDKNTILSFTRIEPPLHPASFEKIVEDIGITPEEFSFEKFNKIVDNIQSENRPVLNDVHFAPFALYKNLWFDIIGGFDTQFRCSREDSDFVVRCNLNGIKLIQSWKTIVYHFTCVSSRGKDWFKTDDKQIKIKNELQGYADHQELLRFIRKWGKFGHNISGVYDIGFVVEMDSFVNLNVLLGIEPYFSKIYINDSHVVNYMIDTLQFDSEYYSNLRWNYTKDYWDSVKHKFNPFDFKEKVLFSDGKNVDNDVIVYAKNSDLIESFKLYSNTIMNIHEIIHTTDVGIYEYGNLKIEIKNKNNKIDKMKSLNTNWDYLIKDPICIFE